MNRTTKVTAALTLLFSVLWLVFLVAEMSTAGPLDTFERVLAWTAKGGLLYRLTYLNAVMVTLSATAFFAALYHSVRGALPTRAMVGLVFVPAYCAINLLVYVTQITVVPALIEQLNDPAASGAATSGAAASGAAARLLLMMTMQQWPASSAAFFNNLAYGLLGIPSIIFGLALARRPGAVRAGGLLLALNGAACIIAAASALLGVRGLAIGSLIGGVFFITSLPFLLVGPRREG